MYVQYTAQNKCIDQKKKAKAKSLSCCSCTRRRKEAGGNTANCTSSGSGEIAGERKEKNGKKRKEKERKKKRRTPILCTSGHFPWILRAWWLENLGAERWREKQLFAQCKSCADIGCSRHQRWLLIGALHRSSVKRLASSHFWMKNPRFLLGGTTIWN